jgi:hypothetical protein
MPVRIPEGFEIPQKFCNEYCLVFLEGVWSLKTIAVSGRAPGQEASRVREMHACAFRSWHASCALCGPVLSIPEIANMSNRHAVESGYLPLRSYRIPDLFYHLVRDSGGANVASLGEHVSRVVCRGAQEQMIDPSAGWVVTSMEHAQAIWDRAVGLGPRPAVGKPLPALALHLPVALLVTAPCVLDAGSRHETPYDHL